MRIKTIILSLFNVIHNKKNKVMSQSADDLEKKEFTLVETTQQQILNYINNEGLKVNDTLPKENELADLLGVSRVVVREALSSLRSLGFVETKKKKGTILLSPKPFDVIEVIISSGALSESTVKDLYELRLMLEIGLADFVFERKDEANMAKLLKLIEEEEHCEDSQRLVEIDIEFHSILYKMANSRSLSNFQNLLGKTFMFYPHQRPENWRSMEIITHRSLYRILDKGNPEAFRSAMRLHLTYQFSNRDEYLQTYYDNISHFVGGLQKNEKRIDNH